MDHLPVEILMIIFSFLEQTDVENFRQVSQVFARIGLGYLEIGKNFCFRKHSLERLHWIAQDPVLSRNLKDIVFFVDVVPAFDSRRRWQNQAKAMCYPPFVGTDKMALRWLQLYKLHQLVPMRMVKDDYLVQAGWRYQHKIRREQAELLQDSENTFKSLQQSLTMLPNLRAFSMETYTSPRFQKDKLIRPLFIIEPRQAWCCRNGETSLEGFRIVSTRIFHAALTGRSSDDLSRHIGSHLSILKIASMDFANVCRNLLNDAFQISALEHVRVLHVTPIRIHTGEDDDESSNSLDTEVFWWEDKAPLLQLLLKNTPNLHTLILLGTMNQNPLILFEDGILPQLLYLDLCSVRITLANFKAFLSTHARCLKELKIGGTVLTAREGRRNWIELLKFIKENLNLSELMLEHFFWEDDLDTTFNTNALHTFGSGIFITVRDAARFLVCGKYLSDEELMSPLQHELSSLTWQDLAVAAYS